MLTSFNVIIFLKIYPMISTFKLFPNFNISQNFVQNVQKQKNTFVLSWNQLIFWKHWGHDSKTSATI